MRIKQETLAAAAGKGLLEEGQVEPLWGFLASRSTFNFVCLAYFFGALLIIGAFSVFMVTAWEAYGGAAILAQKHYAAIEARAGQLIPAAWKRVLPSQR